MSIDINKCKYLIGEVFKNNDGFEFEIIGYPNKKRRRLVRFKSGYEVEVYTDAIKSGKVKDYLSPTILGVGVLGFRGASNHFLYKRWVCMLQRCYCEKCHEYKMYGGKGVKVEDYLLNFQNYVKFVESLDNYDNMFKNPKKYNIDKDTKEESDKNYKRENLKIITVKENIDKAIEDIKVEVNMFDRQGNLIRSFESICEASRYTGIFVSNIQSALRGDYKHAGGYIWKRKRQG